MEQFDDGADQRVWTFRFWDAGAFAGRRTGVAVTAVQDEGYVAFAQATAELLGVTVAKAKVEHGRRQAILLDNAARLVKRACRHCDGASPLEGIYDVQGN